MCQPLYIQKYKRSCIKTSEQMYQILLRRSTYLFLQQKEATMWIRPWSWAANTDGGSSWTVECSSHCSRTSALPPSSISAISFIFKIFKRLNLIVVHIKVVGGREDSYETWEACCLAFAVHPVPAARFHGTCAEAQKTFMSCDQVGLSPGILGLVCSDDREKVVLL